MWKLTHREAEVVMVAAGYQPLAIYPGADTPWPCYCTKCKKQSAPRYSNVKNGSRCVHCTEKSKLRLDPAATTAVMRAAGLRPLVPYPGANIPWLCICGSCGQQVTPRYNNVQKGQGGCINCTGKKKLDPEAAAAVMRAVGLEPLTPYPGANTPWPCRCGGCGAEVAPRYCNAKKGRAGCSHCARPVRVPEPVKPVVDRAELMRENGFEPLEPYPGADAPWLCRCTRCGKESRPRRSTVKDGHRCKFCAGKRAGLASAALLAAAGKPRVALDPDLAERVMWVGGLKPLVPYPGYATKWLCKCLECGLEVTPKYVDIKRGQGGCIHCVRQCRRDCYCRAA